VNPILVPQTFKNYIVYTSLENLVRDLVISVSVHTEVCKFIVSNHLKTLLGILSIWFVIVRVATEATNLDFTSRNCPLWVNNNSNSWVLHHLHSRLSCDIDTREPAAVTGMRVVPSADTLWSIDFLTLILMVNHERSSILISIDSGLTGLDWETVDIHNIHSVSDWVTLEVAHDLNIATSTAMHRHLNQGDSRDPNLLEVMNILLPRLVSSLNSVIKKLGKLCLIDFVDLLVLHVVLELESFLSCL